MKEFKRLAKLTFCMATAFTVIGTANTAKAETTNVYSETGIAGVSLSLDKYYAVALEATHDLLNISTEDMTKEGAKATETEKSEYENTGISIASSYVNIRKQADATSKVVGKLYKGAAATITKTDGEWVKIKSGSVVGYIKKEYLAIGIEAEKIADKYSNKTATVNTTTLKVREKKSTDSVTLTLIPLGGEFEVISVDDEWVKIEIDSDITGYVASQYVDVSEEFDKAISIKEEQEKLRKQQEEEQAAANANNNTSSSTTSSSSNSSSSSSSKKNNSSSSSTSSKKNNSSSSSSSSSSNSSSSGRQIANYALQFVGNPYVYGGNSLTRGTDCSGFVKLVYAHFGYSISRTASSQAASAGRKVSISSVQPGDLIFYAKNGSITHVAMYIGNNKVVHASTPKSGIKISNMNYRTPYMARRIVR